MKKFKIHFTNLIDRRENKAASLTVDVELREPTSDTRRNDNTPESFHRGLRKDLESSLVVAMNEANRQGFELGPDTSVRLGRDTPTSVSDWDWIDMAAERLLNCNAHIAPEDVPMKKQKLAEELEQLLRERRG